MDKLELEKREKLDLRKNMVLDLKKNAGLTGQKATVILAMDFSGSMTALYRSGKVQELAERILPLGLAFDDNGEVDFYIFHEGFHKIGENLTINNFHGYIDNKIIGKYQMGGTDYAPVINDIVKKFGNETKSGGFFGMGGSKATKVLECPVYVIFVTDGETSNHSGVTAAVKEASNHGIFFQFVGIGDQSFGFLSKLDTMPGRFLDNANFCQMNDVAAKTDDQLYKLLLNEFPSWIPQARSKGLIK
jgi:hypothetical protein